jgi:CheY-like chemotaxis protein
LDSSRKSCHAVITPCGAKIGYVKGGIMTARDARTLNGRPPHVLVIDDAPELLDLFVELLEEEGYRVSTSRTLLALDEISAIAPDAIVHDLIFAEDSNDVWQSLRRTRLDSRLAPVPLILCTADTRVARDRETVARLERLGIPVILKPFAIEAMLNVLADALARTAPNVRTSPGSRDDSQHAVMRLVDWSAAR